MSWFATFLVLYGAGASAAAALVPSRVIGPYFFRFVTLLVLVMGVVTFLVGRPLSAGRPAEWRPLIEQTAAAAFALACLVQSIVVRGGASPRVALIATSVAGAVHLAAAGGGVFGAAHLTASGAVLGTSLVAMILGHWYLSDAALPFEVLQRLTRAFLAAAVARLVLSAVLLAMQWDAAWAPAESFTALLVIVRLVVSFACTPALAAMAHRCAMIRANQSATGILYAAVAVVLVGEVVATYLALAPGARIAL